MTAIVTMREQLLARRVTELEEALSHATRFVFGRFVATTFHYGLPGAETSWRVYPFADGKLGASLAGGMTQAEAVAMAHRLYEESQAGGDHG